MTKLIDTTQVTQEEISRCDRCLNSKNQPFYMVLSETDNLTEYKVEAKIFNGEYRYTCTCESGKRGFANVKHPSGTCKHVRWSIAAGKQYKANLKAQTQVQAKPAVTKIVDTVPAWMLTARPAPHMRKAPRELSR